VALEDVQEQGAALKALNAYIAREVLKGSLLAVLVLLALLNFFTFTDEMGDMTGGYGLVQIFEYLALDSPRNFYELIPSAALLGSLVTLGALGNNRELVAMQAAGASKFRIIWAVMRAGLILVVISGVIGEYVAPPAERAAQVLKATAIKQQVASRTRYGFWVRDGDTFINIRQIQQRDQLGDISIFELDKNQRLTLVTHAEKAVYDGQHWDLDNLKLSHIHYDTVVPETKAKADWSSVLAPDLLNVFVVRPENLSAYELASYMMYLRDNGQKSLTVELAFWGRIINPFVTLTMLLVATPFVLTLRRETSLGQRVVVGVTFGLGFYLFDRMFGHFGLIYEMPPIFAASFPTVLVFIAASVAIARMR
jgi:lipopolysaccharide export system permease protein